MKNAQWNMIPKDWDIVVLGEYSEIARGGVTKANSRLFNIKLPRDKLDKNW